MTPTVPLPRLAVTLGDPGGIGPEIVVKALSRPDVRAMAQTVVFGSASVIRAAAERLGMSLDWRIVPFYLNPGDLVDALRRLLPSSAAGADSARPLLLRFDLIDKSPFLPGKWSRATGAASLAWVQAAVRAVLPNQPPRQLHRAHEGDDPAAPDAPPLLDALVTAPICKSAWQAAGAQWPGHTELLAAMAREATGVNAREVMLLAGGGLRVALATVHEALAAVPRKLTAERILGVARALHNGLVRDFDLPNPRIAVLGLNPHAGEDGHMGLEEKQVIQPAIDRLRRDGIDAQGPCPADTAFHFARQGRYDAVLAMYHDQGLGPLKTVAFDEGVNITLGLPLVRTSVDHGTAFDIAGTGRASENSMVAAIRQAVDIVGARRRHAEAERRSFS